MLLLAMSGTVVLLAGLGISLLALREHGSPSASRRPSIRPRMWVPVWKTRDRFDSAAGYRLYVFGSQLAGAGALLIAVVLLSRVW
jgi:hypothetical protein